MSVGQSGSSGADMFDRYLDRWNVRVDGVPIVTHSSRLLPVRRGGEPAMLKVAMAAEEERGSGLMLWWDGMGAARVLAHEGNGMLLERAMGFRSLAEIVQCGNDDAASRIICATVAQLHTPRGKPLPGLIPLRHWFRNLAPMAAQQGGILRCCAEAARTLLAEPVDTVPLHGDIHHGNILDFGEERGWLAIDPKGLLGDRYFDYANLFCNPNHTVATTPGRLARQVDIVCEEAGLQRHRLLQWILAWAGLSAVFLIEDGETEHLEPTLRVAEIAAVELPRQFEQ